MVRVRVRVTGISVMTVSQQKGEIWLKKAFKFIN